jgi:ribbon-helix-helix protein
MKSSVIKRSIEIDGHKTSVSLEDTFWSGLKEIGSRPHCIGVSSRRSAPRGDDHVDRCRRRDVVARLQVARGRGQPVERDQFLPRVGLSKATAHCLRVGGCPFRRLHSGRIAPPGYFTGTVLVSLPNEPNDEVGDHAYDRGDDQRHQELAHGCCLPITKQLKPVLHLSHVVRWRASRPAPLQPPETPRGHASGGGQRGLTAACMRQNRLGHSFCAPCCAPDRF